MRLLLIAMLAVAAPAWAAAAGADGACALAPTAGLPRAEAYRQARDLAAVGRRMFFDPVLSASGAMACASCHSPAHAYGPPDGRAVQLGGSDMRKPGLRAVPTLTYKQATPQFTEHFHNSDDDGDESVDGGPTGGLGWDGRVDRGCDQALIPLLSPFEMANADRAALDAVIAARYGADLRAALGEAMPQGPLAALAAGARAIETFEQEPEFYPYDSKYDAFLAGKASLTPQEARGLVLFEDPAKGNCSHCHISQRGGDGTPPQFTDYGMIALGAPRNRALPANADPTFYDLGLCGPERTDFRDRPAYCGLFKTPTLRNVATRQVFFHNGVFRTLKEVMDFYARRDTNPELFYPRGADGKVLKYDDLPPQYHDNVNVEPPFDRHPGDPPALTDAEIDDIIAFLKTLTDGYRLR